MLSLSRWAAAPLPLLAVFALMPAPVCAAPDAPAGWGTTRTAEGTVFTPPGLQAGETYQVTVMPRLPLGGRPLTEFLQRLGDRDAPALGTNADMAAKVKADPAAPMVATLNRTFTAPGGETRLAIYFALSFDARTVRVTRTVFTAKEGLLQRYEPGLNAILESLVREGRPAAAPTKAAPTPAPAGMTSVGGAITPGKYTGDYVSDGKVRGQRTIYLYANGEYRLLNNGVAPDFNTGQIVYEPDTGKLMIHRTIYSLFNDTDSPEETYCFYGHAADGIAVILGHQGYPIVVDQVLRYAGKADTPAPAEVAAQKAKVKAAKEEAERYKYVTVPSKGLKESQIDSVVMHFEMGVLNTLTNTMMGGEKTLYLLLKDGTFHEGLPVAPCVLDAALSRRKEPEAWGTWKRGAGKETYLLTRRGRTVPLEATPMQPVRPGDLRGHFGRAFSTGDILSGGSVTQWGVAFGQDSRFRTDRSFSFSNGVVAQSSPLNPVLVYGGGDETGTYTSASGGGATITEQTKRARKAGSTVGVYALQGYSLILRYDNGVTEYTPCYFEDDARTALNFQGGVVFKGT